MKTHKHGIYDGLNEKGGREGREQHHHQMYLHREREIEHMAQKKVCCYTCIGMAAFAVFTLLSYLFGV